MKITSITKISRPRFWIYTAGTYLLGSLIGNINFNFLTSWEFLLTLLFFLVPANFFLYGINDLYDDDTDKFNTKKNSYENRLKTGDRNNLKILLVCTLIIFLIYTALLQNGSLKITLFFFLFLSYFYSAKPLRFKSKPVIDSLSNFLYILPGIFGYIQTSGQIPPLLPVIGFWAWAAAMHLFSAIPDITPDKKAGLLTTAVFYGKNTSLIICALLWLVFTLITLYQFKEFLLLPIIIYPLIPLVLLINKSLSVSKVYKFFPLINTAFGFTAFIIIFTKYH